MKAEDGTPKYPEFLEHIIMPEDTLTGICMRYKVQLTVLLQIHCEASKQYVESLAMCRLVMIGQTKRFPHLSYSPVLQHQKIMSILLKIYIQMPHAKCHDPPIFLTGDSLYLPSTKFCIKHKICTSPTLGWPSSSSVWWPQCGGIFVLFLRW